MDRADGNLKLSCNSIEEKLEIPAIYLQLPIVQEGKLIGLEHILYQLISNVYLHLQD